MTTPPAIGQRVTFNANVIPEGMRRMLGCNRDGVVTQVTWNQRIGVQVENVGVVWCDAIDVETEVTK